MAETLTVALPKGRLAIEVAGLLAGAGFPRADLDDDRLLVEVGDGLRYLLARPGDVVTYVKEGAADLGVTGKDILLENPGGYYELLDLGIGRCVLAVAGRLPAGVGWEEFLARKGNRLRVATKHPNASRDWFAARGVAPAIIPLGGALELAPQVGLADVIVDLVQTGRTLKANGLSQLAEVAQVTARLIANPVSMRFKAQVVERLADGLRRAVAAGEGGAVGAGRIER